MISDIERECPDCEHSMTEIRLLDRTYGGEGDVEYTIPNVKRSFWTSRYPVTGKVAAFMCDECGRIVLYGTRRVK